MKEKDRKPAEPESYIEKERKHRDRTKKRRLTAEETVEAHKPRMVPYRRKKNWMQLPYDSDEDN